MSRETSVKEWRRSAESDRQAAKHLLDAGDYEACVFHCQQAVEKLLKAVIIKQGGGRPERTHDLNALLEKITGLEKDKDIEQIVSEIDGYYIGSRYPLDTVDPGIFVKPLAEKAVQYTDEIFKWFLTRLVFENE